MGSAPEVYEEIKAVAGEDAAEKLAAHFGGQKVYFPVWDKARQQRDRAIIEDHAAGMQPAELAEKYSLTPRRIRQILTRE